MRQRFSFLFFFQVFKVFFKLFLVQHQYRSGMPEFEEDENDMENKYMEAELLGLSNAT